MADPAHLALLDQGVDAWNAARRQAGDLPDLEGADLSGRLLAGIELFAREYPHDYPEVEATLVALRSGLRLSQVQVEMRERETGASSITFIRSLYYIVKVLLALLVASLRRYPRLEGARR